MKDKAKEKDNKIGLIVFRLPESVEGQLNEQFRQAKVLDVKSTHQFARKIVTDYLSGRLVYLDPQAVADNQLLRVKQA